MKILRFVPVLALILSHTTLGRAQAVDQKYLDQANEIANLANKNAERAKESAKEQVVVIHQRLAKESNAAKYYPKQVNEAITPFSAQSPILGAQQAKDKRLEKERLMVFISSSMPVAAIKSYLDEAQKYNAAVLIKGFVGDSLRDTTKFFETIGLTNANLKIDPHSFELFNVQSVPTIILTDTSSDQSEITPIHDRVMGNVPIEYALRLFEREGEVSAIANSILREVQQ